MESCAVGVGSNGQDDLGMVIKVVAAVSVAREGRGNGVFEADAGEVVEGETYGFFECVGCEFLSKAHQ